MKRIVALLLVLLFVLSSVQAFALGQWWHDPIYDSWTYYDYDDTQFWPYLVNSSFYESGAYRIYMYAEPSSNGTPISTYVNGTIIKVINDWVDNNGTWAFAIGPDGKVGYVRNQWIEMDPYPLSDYPVYVVQSDYVMNGRYLAFLYPEPSSMYDAIATYNNGTELHVLDLYASNTYAKVLGPNNVIGYIRRSWIRPKY